MSIRSQRTKTYETCNLVEGGFFAGERIAAIEDVATTAGQIATSVCQMRELGLLVEHALCIIEREQGGRENLEKLGCSLCSVFTLDELERFAQEGEK